MDQRPAKPENAPWITPYLTVKDASASLAFYQKAFGFEIADTLPGPDGKIAHASMNYKGIMVIMLSPEGAYGNTSQAPSTNQIKSPISMYVYCDDVNALYTQAKAAGADVVMEPEDMFWGDRMTGFKDPDGHLWNFATNISEFDESKIPSM